MLGKASLQVFWYKKNRALHHTIAIGRIGSTAVRNMPLQDLLRWNGSSGGKSSYPPSEDCSHED
jgi:hypothetical protein